MTFFLALLALVIALYAHYRVEHHLKRLRQTVREMLAAVDAMEKRREI